MRALTFMGLILLMVQSTLFTQSSTDSIPGAIHLNNINGNVFGDVSFFSLNYERQSMISPFVFLSSKIGVGFNEEIKICFSGNCDPAKSYLMIPHHLTANLGKRVHFFEMGLGGTYIFGNPGQPYLLYPILGYRVFPVKLNGVNLRIYVQTPFKELEIGDIIQFPIGLSIGVSF
jgi:hypothetical protein